MLELKDALENCLNFSPAHSLTTLGQCRIKELLFHLSQLVISLLCFVPIMEVNGELIFLCLQVQDVTRISLSSVWSRR